MHKRGQCNHAVSVQCPSVLLFVTFVYCVKTSNYIVNIFSLFISYLTAILRRGPPNWGKNCDFRPLSGFWNRWLAECRQQFRPRSRPNLKHEASTSVYCANRHVSVTLVYDSKTRRVRWREQNSFYRASAHWRAKLIDKSCPSARVSVRPLRIIYKNLAIVNRSRVSCAHNSDPLLISATAEGSDFKFGIQLGLQEYDIKTVLFHPYVPRIRIALTVGREWFSVS